ncbi:hypothetical protein [Escherichia phage ZCEC14]|nr:hypothetical protein [Escherichia phage ZCEC14]
MSRKCDLATFFTDRTNQFSKFIIRNFLKSDNVPSKVFETKGSSSSRLLASTINSLDVFILFSSVVDRVIVSLPHLKVNGL